MTLTDAGPLVALLDRKDSHHDRVVRATRMLPREPLLTTWPCFTEAMYLLGRAGGYPAQRELWGYIGDGALHLHTSTPEDTARMAVLMDQYRDTPMDLADASLVAAAETLVHRRVFALDTDFHVYRLADGSALEVIP